MNEAKQWILTFVFSCILILFVVVGFIILTDPMWFFHHKCRLNLVQLPVNERQQKTNWLSTHSVSYDALILGSSRCSYLNQYEFTQYKCYNYSASSMKPEEYEEYLRYFLSQNSQPLKKVFIGLDFFGTNEYANFDFEKPKAIIQNATSSLYFLKMLINLDNFIQGWKNLICRQDHYDRDNVKYAVCPENIDKQLSTYRQQVYGKYSYDLHYKNRLKSLKENFPQIVFQVFTTPISNELMSILEECNLQNDYDRWIREITEVFGTFDHFMILAWESDDFHDAHHLTPKGAKKVIQQLDLKKWSEFTTSEY